MYRIIFADIPKRQGQVWNLSFLLIFLLKISICEKIYSFLRICPYLLKKSLKVNFIFSAVSYINWRWKDEKKNLM